MFKLTEPLSKTVRGIPGEKKNEIIAKLCPLMNDQRKTHFWTGQNVPDLIDHDDADVISNQNFKMTVSSTHSCVITAGSSFVIIRHLCIRHFSATFYNANCKKALLHLVCLVFVANYVD